MPLMENDFDSFGVLFEVRTSGLDSVKGVVNGLISTDKWAKDAHGSLIKVSDAVEVLKKTGMSSKEAMSFISQGGNDLLKFSHQAQRAASDVARFADEFHNLELKRRQLSSAENDSAFQGQLNQVRQQMATITNRLSAQRERVLQQESIGGGVQGFSATERVMRELGATKPLVNFQKLATDASAKITQAADEFVRQLTPTQQVLREQARGIAEAYLNVRQQLSAGRKPWYGETDAQGRSIGEMRTGAVLDPFGRPQPGSRARGRDSSGESRDPVLTENMARDLENKAIALRAAHSRLVKAYNGSAEQAEVVLNQWVRSAEQARSDVAAAAVHYQQAILPERAMQRATHEVDQLIRQQTGRPNDPMISNILYPGGIHRSDERVDKIRREALAQIQQKTDNPPDTPEMTRIRERYAALISRARSNITDEVRTKSSRGDYESYEQIKDAENRSRRLESRRDRQLEISRLGPTEYYSRRLEQSTSAAESIAQMEKLNHAYKELFGSRKIDDLVKEIESLDIPVRDKRSKINALESKYATFLRDGDMPQQAEDVERRVRERQRQARLERANERARQFDEESRQRLSILSGSEGSATSNPMVEAYRRAAEEARRTVNPQSGDPRKALDDAALDAAKKLRETGNKIVDMAGGGRSTGPGSAPDYTQSVANARRLLRSTVGVSGGSGADEGDNPFTPRNSRAYERMIDAERVLDSLQRQRGRNIQDLDTRARRLGDLEFATQQKIAEAAARTRALQEKASQIREDSIGKVAAKEYAYEEQKRIAEFKFAQDQERTAIRISELQQRRQVLVDKTFNDVPNDKGRRDRLIEERDEQVARLDRGIRLLQEVRGVPGTTGLRERQLQFGQAQATFELDQYKATQRGRVEAASVAAQQAAEREERVRVQSGARLKLFQDEFVTRERRIHDDLGLKREEAERRIARARVRYTEDSLKEIDRIFSRKSETLEETLMRTRRPGAFQAARDAQSELIGGDTMDPLRRANVQIEAVETSSQSYKKLREQITGINAELDKKREKVEQEKSAGLDRLGLLQMHAETVAPEFRPHAEDLLEAQRVRTTERVTKLQGEYLQAEDAALRKSTRAHEQYTANLANEQKKAARAFSDASAQSMFNLMLQFGGVIAAVKGFVVETVQYAARTETMRIVTEQMARTNDINTKAVLDQVSAIKSLNITTQEAHGVVQRMIFAQLDVAKATQLARVAQNAATVSGENSSETLNKIITGIVTGQTRLLHYMGLQVSMQQTIRQLRAELGREPTEIEKRTAMLNAVLAEGTKISGNYEAAMLTAGKQVLSLKRQFQEAQNAIGQEFQPTYTRVIALMSGFANAARQNASEIAFMTRAVAGLTTAFLALQTSNFLLGTGGKLLTTLGGSLGLVGAAANSPWFSSGSIANAWRGAGAAGAGVGGQMLAAGKAVPWLNWAALLGSVAIGAGVFSGSGSTPMEGVKSTISSTKSQQEMDRRQMELAFRLGDIDSQSYQEAMSRFYEQDRALRRKAITAVSQVWIDQARKAAETSQEFQRENAQIVEQGFFKSYGTLMSRVGRLAAWPFMDNKYKQAGFTAGEFIAGTRVGTASNSDQEFKNVLLRLRKKIQDEGDVITAQGVISVQEKLRDFDAWAKMLEGDKQRKNDPLYNVRLMLQQETDNLDDIIGKKVESMRQQVTHIQDRIIDRAILDPVEKIRQKMESALFEHDVTQTTEFKAALRQMQSLERLRSGRGDTSQFSEYRALADRVEKLGLSQDQLLTYQKAMSGQDEKNPNIIHFGDRGIMLRSARLEQFGLTSLAPQLDEYETITRRMRDLREGTVTKIDPKTGKILQEATKGDPELELRLRLERATDKNREDQARLRSAFQIEINQELLSRRQKYEGKQAEFEISRAGVFTGPGVEAERSAVQATFESRRQLEEKQSQDRITFINQEFTAQKMRRDGQTVADAEKESALARQSMIASEIQQKNEKLRELDNQRILNLEQINAQQRQIALSIDVERVQNSLRAQTAVLSAQLRGDEHRLELAQQIHDLEVATAEKILSKDRNQGDFIKRKDTADLELFLKQVDAAKDKVDKAKSGAEELIKAQFDRAEKVLHAQAMGPLDEMVAARRLFELKKQQIDQLWDLDQKVATGKKDREDADDRRTKARADAELEFLQQRMELFKKQREEGMKMAGDVFDAMERQIHGQKGFSDFFTGIFKTTEKQIFQNLFGDLFTETGRKLTVRGQGSAEHRSWLGNVLQGTLFGIKDDPRADIAKYNRELVLRQDSLIKSTDSSSTATTNLQRAMERLTTAINSLNGMKAPGLQAPLYTPVAGPGYPSFTPGTQGAQGIGQVVPGGPSESPALTPDDPEYWGLPAGSTSKPPFNADGSPMVAKAAGDRFSPLGISNGSYRSFAEMKAKLGLFPTAHTKVGNRPVWTYNEPGIREGGEHLWGTQGVLLNMGGVSPQMQRSVLSHELTHDIMEPAIPGMVADKELQGYFGNIRKGLVDKYGDLYKGENGKPLADNLVMTEALAYNTQYGEIPGLNSKQRQSFVDRAMSVASQNKQQDLVELYRRLQTPEGGELADKAAAPDDVDLVKEKIRRQALAQGVDPAQVLGLAESESGFDQGATSKTGARGVFQFTRGTAKGLGIDRENLDQNISGGVKYWKQLLDKNGGDVSKALSAYKGVGAGGATPADVARAQKLMSSYAQGGLDDLGMTSSSSEAPTLPTPYIPQNAPDAFQVVPQMPHIPEAPVPGFGATRVAPWDVSPIASRSLENVSTAAAAIAGTSRSTTVASDVGAIGGAGSAVIEDVLKSTGHGGTAENVDEAAKNVSLAASVSRAGGSNTVSSLTSQGFNTYRGLYGAINNIRTKHAMRDYNELSSTIGSSKPSGEQLDELNKYRKRLGMKPLDTPTSDAPAPSEIGPEGVAEGNGGPKGTEEFADEGSGEGASRPGSMTGKVATGMEVAGAGVLAYNAFRDFSRGGAQGALGGAQDLLGIASMIPGPQQPFIMAGAMALGFVKSLLGDPRAKYKKMLEEELKRSHFSEADAQERTMDTSGNLIDFDFLGQPRAGAFPTNGPLSHLSEMQYTEMLQANSGRTGSGVNPGQLAQLAVNVNVNTMDSKSFMDNSGKIADAMRQQLILNHPVGNEIRQIAGV